jgi:uncharacterized OB-fold protein
MTVGPVDRDAATAEFFDAAADGQFLLRRCPSGHYSEPATAQCTTCAATDLSWAAASGGASLVSWAVTWGKPQADAEPVATIMVIAALDEGPWWWSQLDGGDPAHLTVGARLTIAFRSGGAEHVPVFELAGQAVSQPSRQPRT